jgi:hypothetical protein
LVTRACTGICPTSRREIDKDRGLQAASASNRTGPEKAREIRI